MRFTDNLRLLVVFPQCPADVTIGITLGSGIALVMLRFALAQAKLKLHATILEVDLKRNQGVSLPGNQTIQLADLRGMHQQLSGP